MMHGDKKPVTRLDLLAQFLEHASRNLGATQIAPVIAVADARRELSQVAIANRLTARGAGGLRAWCSAAHEHEFHVPPPKEKQNTVSAG